MTVKNLGKVIKAPTIIMALFLVKMLTYYYLIGVDVLNNILVLSSVLIFGILFIALSRGNVKKKKGCFLILISFFSIIMFADSMYYNYYNQTVSIRQLWQASNVAKVPSSFVATLIPASFILLIDIPIIYYFFKKYSETWNKDEEQVFFGRKLIGKKVTYLVVGVLLLISVLVVNPLESIKVQKITSVEFFTSHIGDIYQTAVAHVSAEELAEEEVLETVEEIVEEPIEKKYHGLAEGKNLILLQVEAYQDFLIGAEYNGQELTPNLNKLLEKDTLYYDNYYSNIGKGNTADAEFSTLNSLYPVIEGESYRLFMENTYNGLPWLLKNEGYSTFAIHGYEGDFWNRNEAYPYQGFDEFFSMEDLDSSKQIGLGISDKSMFHQSADILEQEKNPFFAFIITLTNHHPYILDEELQEIELLPEHEDTKFGSYLQTAYYTDQAIGQFMEELKEKGLYEDTVIALYGDHHGLNCNMDDNDIFVSEYLGRTYDYDEMFNVPLMIHIPGSGLKETVSTLGGQIDFLPTISNLFALDNEQPYVLGQDLNNAEAGFVAFTAYLFEGSFAKDDVMFEISREGIFEGSRAWRIGTGEELDINQFEEDYEKAVSIKEASKRILEQDLIAEYVSHGVKAE